MPHIDLLELPYFEGISLDEVVALVDRMEPRYYPAGNVIVSEGDTSPPSLYIVTAGRVAMSKRAPDTQTERQLAELNCPTLFGEVELLCGLPAVTTTRAITPVSAFALTRATFDSLLTSQHAALMLFVCNVARVACHRLAIADELMVSLLHDEDLVKMRSNIFARQDKDSTWTRTTGVFRLPK